MAEDKPTAGRGDVDDKLVRIDELMAVGDYTEALAACHELLHQQPTSAVLHEKMGDILFARELWDDAAEWYELARQLQNTPEIEDKLAEARRRDRAARMGDMEPEKRSTRPSPAMLTLLAIAAIVTVTVVVILVTGWLRSRSPQATTQSPTPVGAGEFSPAPAATNLSTGGLPRSIRSSPAAPRGGGAQAGAHENPSGHWSAGLPPQRAPRRDTTATRIESLTEPVTDHDRLVIDAVGSLTWGDDRPLSGRVAALVDEYQGYAVVRVTVPPTVPASNLAEQLVMMAYRVALTAVRADEAINAITVQMVRARSGSGGATMEIIWRGNASRRNLEEHVDLANDPGALLTQVFATVRWSAELRSSVPAPQPGMPDTGEPGATP
ncbi:MAG: hypothetical protein J7M38_05295 [Armatimonadetes bacterium]|nr:hypothetical protein [Armatimonadota bacterium]